MFKCEKPGEFEDDIFELDKPTFLVKIKVNGYSRQKVEETIRNFSNKLKSNNANFWIIPIEEGDSNIELVWGGENVKQSNLISNIVEKEINDETVLYKEFEESGYFNVKQLDKIKFILRTTKLKNLLNEY